MTQWSKRTLENYYETDLTDNDCRIINEEFDGVTWDNIEEDTRIFEDIRDYVYYIYDTDEAISSFFQLLTYLATEETEAQYTVRELLLGDEAVELDKGKIMIIMG